MFFPEVKQLGYETNHLPATSAEVKDECNYISVPSYYLLHAQGQLLLTVSCLSVMACLLVSQVLSQNGCSCSM